MQRQLATPEQADAMHADLDWTLAGALVTVVLMVAMLVVASYPLTLVLGGASLVFVTAVLGRR